MNKELRIVFMGTPDFAVASLKALLDAKFNVVGVITAPDRPAGRGQKLQMSAVKKFALKHNLPVLQPTKLKSKRFLAELKSLEHNLQVVVAFRMLPEIVFTMPKYGCFNLHGSLLPQYRGAAPINWAVMNGEKESGVTTFFLKKKVDTGDIIAQEKVKILANDTAGSLHDKLMETGANLVVNTCKQIQENKVSTYPQPTNIDLKDAPKIFREDCEINWNQPTEIIYNFIRGLSPYPASWTTLHNLNFKIYEATPEYSSHNFSAGKIISDHKTNLKFATQDGFISCNLVQLQGKRKMKTEDFLRGYNKEF